MAARHAIGGGVALLAAAGLTPAALAQGADGLDANGDGDITVEDLVAYGQDLPEGERPFSEVYEFDITGGVTAEEYAQLERGRLDADADGEIDEEEYAAWMQDSGGAAGADAASSGGAAAGGLSDQGKTADAMQQGGTFETDFEGVFASFDADGDGSLSQEEFLRAEFSRFDADGNGTLDEEELGRLMEAQGG